MKPTTPQLDALLTSRQFYAVDLWQLVLFDGVTTTRYCSGDTDIVFGGNTYTAGGMSGALWRLQNDSGTDATWETGTAASSLNVTVIPRSETLLGNPFTTACRYGVLDGATLKWSLAIMPTYGDTGAGGVIDMFLGRIVEVDLADLAVSLSINSPMELLDHQMPRNIFQPACINTLYDASCTLDQNAFKTDVSVQFGSTTSTLLLTGSGQASGYFDQGKIKFSTGANAGTSRSIRKWTSPGTAVIYPPLPVAPAAGDNAAMFAGCDKTSATCTSRFANVVNFRGMPSIPQPESAA